MPALSWAWNPLARLLHFDHDLFVFPGKAERGLVGSVLGSVLYTGGLATEHTEATERKELG